MYYDAAQEIFRIYLKRFVAMWDVWSCVFLKNSKYPENGFLTQ